MYGLLVFNPIIPAIIAGVSAIAQGITNAAAQKRANQQAKEYAEQAYEKQKQDNLTFWEKQNQYNSPQNQMQRFTEAGLNPNLIYGQSNTGGPISTPDVKPWNPEPVDFAGPAIGGATTGISTYFDLKQQQATIDNLEKQGKVLDAQEQKLIWDGMRSGQEFDIKDRIRNMKTPSGQLGTYFQEYATEQLRALTAGNKQKQQEFEFKLEQNPLTLSKLKTEIYNNEQLGSLRAKENIVKKLEVELSKLGIRPQDPLPARLIIMLAQKFGFTID